MLSRRGQDSQRRLDVGPGALPLEAEPHDLGGDERGLAVGVEGEDVAGDEEQPVDVLVEVGQHRVDQLVVLKGEQIDKNALPVVGLISQRSAAHIYTTNRL